MKRRALVATTLTPLGVLGVAGVAFAFWTVASTGATGTAAADSLQPAQTVTTSGVTFSNVTVNVTAAPSTGPTPTSYRVDRTGSSPVPGVCSISGSTGSCADPSPVSGQTNSYAVYSLLGTSWVSSTAATVSVAVPSSDTTAPTTTATPSPVPNGVGWNKVNLAVLLAATDNSGGSGVKQITYSASGAQTIGSTTVSGSSTSVNITAEGTTTLSFFATDNATNVESTQTVTIKLDKTGPTNFLTLTGATGNKSFLNGSIVYYQGQAVGSFQIRNALTDALSGPASSATSALGGTSTGWTPIASTVTTPPGGPYVSGVFSWAAATSSSPTETVTGADVAENTTSSGLTFTNDVTGPTGGSVTYANSNSTSTSASIGFTAGSDAGSGLNAAGAVLQRENAPYTGGVCGSYGGFSNVTPSASTSPYADSGLSDGCYKYQYVVSDNVGNPTAYTSANVVQVDTTKPVVPAPTVAANIKNGAVIVDAVTDAGSGVGTVSYFYCAGTAPCTTGGTSIGSSSTGPSYSVIWNSQPADGNYQVYATATDAVGNTQTSSTSSSTKVDNTAPTVTVNQAAGQADPTNAVPMNWTVTFSEPVTGFTSSSVTRSGTTGGTIAVTGSGASYNIAISGTPAQGATTFTVAAGQATDPAGNGNTASTSTDNSITYDTVAPTVTVNQASGQADPTGTVPMNWTVSFTESVTGFSSASLTRGGTTGGTVTVTGSGASYNIALAGTPTQGATTFSIAANQASDAAGNGNTASTSSDNSITYDTVAPTVTVQQAAGQTDPTNAVPMNWTVTFNESVTGFSSASLTRGGTSGGTVTVTGSGASYNIALTGTPTQGATTFTIAANKASDAAGNGNTASTSTDNSITYDTVAPTATDVQLSGSAAAGNGTINQGDKVTLTYSELMDASKFCPSWVNDGNAQTLALNSDVTISITDVAGTETLSATSVACSSLKIGNVVLGGQYLNTGVTATFKGNGSNASMITWTPGAKTLTIQLGNPVASPTLRTSVAVGTASYSATSGLSDLAGNALSTSPVNAASASRF
jgi:hypothetical protein